MGNRAVIAFGPASDPNTIGIYLHWHGSPDQILAFMVAAKQLGVRDPLQDDYGIARVTQIIANYIGGDTGIGVNRLDMLDTESDNGVYEVGPGFTLRDIVWRGSARPLSPATLPADAHRDYTAILSDVMAVNRPIFERQR